MNVSGTNLPQMENKLPERQVRKYTSSDRSGVKQIVKAGLEEFAKGKAEKAHTKKCLDKLAKQLNCFDKDSEKDWPQFNRRLWVCEVDEKIIGCAGILNTQQQVLNDKEMVTLHRLSVSKRQRRSGVASDLLDTVEEHCRQEKIKRIRLTTQTNLKPAMAFYEKRGYKITSNKTKTVTKSNKGLVKYELRLDRKASPK